MNSTSLKSKNERLEKKLERLAKLNLALNRETSFLQIANIDTDYFFNIDPAKSTMAVVLDVQQRRTQQTFKILQIQSQIDQLLEQNKGLSAKAKNKLLKSNIAECHKLKRQFEAYSTHDEATQSRFSHEEQLSRINERIAYWEFMLKESTR